MQERRAAKRVRANLNVRWETLKTQGRGTVSDLSSSGCFVLTGGDVAPQELTRMDLVLPDEVTTLWGHVVYSIHEMGFAIRFAGDDDRHALDELITRLGLPNLE